MCVTTGGCYVRDNGWFAMCVTTGGCYVRDDWWLIFV